MKCRRMPCPPSVAEKRGRWEGKRDAFKEASQNANDWGYHHFAAYLESLSDQYAELLVYPKGEKE